MRQHHRSRRGVVLAALGAVALAALVQPTEAQWFLPACRIDVSLENQLRRVTGAVMTECSGIIHSAPFGNWGVESNYDSRKDTDQVQGPEAMVVHQGPMELLHVAVYDGPWTNDGCGKQKADPDDIRVAGKEPYYGDRLVTCRDYMGEVYTAEDMEMGLWELDRFSRDAHITTLEYGDIDVRICRLLT